MNKQTNLKRVDDSGIVAILRASQADRLVEVGEALLAGGIDIIEITFTVPRAMRVLEAMAEKIGDRILLGAGTILDSETARVAIFSGAEFIVSPSFNPNLVELCQRYDKAVMPGAFTPTEVVNAWQAGADIVKVFPADIGGPSYLRTLRGPLPQVKLLPTGGINLATLGNYLAAGACAVGVGGSVAPVDAIESGDLQRIEHLARQFREAFQQSRATSP